MTEEEFRLKVRQIAKLYGWANYHTPAFKPTHKRLDPGWPDEVLCHPGRGRVIFAELKRDRAAGGRAPTAAQREWLERLQACGQEVALWRPVHLPLIQRVLGPHNERAELFDS